MKIYSVGDSHCNYTFNGIASGIHYLPGVTMHRVGRDGDWISQVVQDLPHDHLLVFCFGEIDVRCHVHRQITEQNRQEQQVLSALVTAYESALCACTHPNKGVLCVVPPCRYTVQKNNPQHPFIGTDQDRLRYTRGLNVLLKDMCKRNDWVCIDVTEPYSASDGVLADELSDGSVHIGDTCHVRSILLDLGLLD